MKIFYCLMAMLCFVKIGFTQPGNKQVSPLFIGDTLPVSEVVTIKDNQQAVFSFSDSNNKLVILDFWATWCQACVKSLSKMQQLTQQYKADLQVLLLNEDPKDDVLKTNEFLKRLEQNTGSHFTLPYVVKDTIFRNYFPHTVIPHCVWIKNRKVIAITDAEVVNEANIKSVLTKQDTSLSLKNDALLYNRKDILKEQDSDGDTNNLLYHSLLTKFNPTLGNRIGKITGDDKKITKFYAINSSLQLLLGIAYRSIFNNDPKKIINETSSDLDARYCYELITPPTPLEEILVYMGQDLQRNFHVVPKREIRDIDIYLLSPLTKTKKNKAVEKRTQSIPVSLNEISTLLTGLTDTFTKVLPSLDGNTTIPLPVDYVSLSKEKMITILQQRGYKISPSKSLEQVVVIYDSSLPISSNSKNVNNE